MGKNILITGASGLIGTRLTQILLKKGHRVSHLGRKKQNADVPEFIWDIDLGIVDPRAIANADVIIHLAGAGVAEQRWTSKRKAEIIDSRVKSTELLYTVLKKGNYPVKTFISGSAIGYYGFADAGKVFTESDGPGTDFLAQVTSQWEAAADNIKTLGVRLVKIRTGVVLSADGGALKSIAKPVKFGLGAPLGTGRQIVSWIHIDDLCQEFCKAVEDVSLSGAYNGVAPNPVTNRELTETVARVLKRPMWLPKVPGVAMKLILGEMADIVLKGSNVSAEKIQSTGFQFQFPDLTAALKNIYNVQ